MRKLYDNRLVLTRRAYQLVAFKLPGLVRSGYQHSFSWMRSLREEVAVPETPNSSLDSSPPAPYNLRQRKPGELR